jgi:hypothetical protein
LNGSYGGISVFAKGTNPNNIADNINLATTGITVNSAGQSGVGANLPPYYALAYIMKTA